MLTLLLNPPLPLPPLLLIFPISYFTKSIEKLIQNQKPIPNSLPQRRNLLPLQLVPRLMEFQMVIATAMERVIEPEKIDEGKRTAFFKEKPSLETLSLFQFLISCPILPPLDFSSHHVSLFPSSLLFIPSFLNISRTLNEYSLPLPILILILISTSIHPQCHRSFNSCSPTRKSQVLAIDVTSCLHAVSFYSSV